MDFEPSKTSLYTWVSAIHTRAFQKTNCDIMLNVIVVGLLVSQKIHGIPIPGFNRLVQPVILR